MADGNYERILNRISKSSGLDKEEVERRVEAKRAKLSGLISHEGAAQIIAAELGVNFDNERLKINELLPGMKKVNVVGKVINLFPVRTFVRNGKEGKVANLIIADETSNMKLVLWDVNHIELIEKGKIDKGSVIEAINGGVRDNEIHLGSFSELKLSDKNLEDKDIKKEKVYKERKIFDFKISSNIKARAFIVQVFEPRFFTVCPECKRKVVSEGENFVCSEHGKVTGEKRAVMNVILDDGSETIRSVIFHDKLKDLGITDLENQETLSKQKQELLGKEMFFFGAVRNNNYFNNLEFIIDKAEEVNLDELLQELEG